MRKAKKVRARKPAVKRSAVVAYDAAVAAAKETARKELVAWIGGVRARIIDLHDELEAVLNEVRDDASLLAGASDELKLLNVMNAIDTAENHAAGLRATVRAGTPGGPVPDPVGVAHDLKRQLAGLRKGAANARRV